MVLLAVSCSRSPHRVGQAVSTAMPVDRVYDQVSDSAYIHILEPIKADLDRQMSAEIGFAAVPLTVGQPESTLSNWSSDVLRLSAKSYCGGREADVAIVNVGGLRCDIPVGPVPLRKIYELMPFDNELVLLTLRGSDLMELCDLFAAVGFCGGFTTFSTFSAQVLEQFRNGHYSMALIYVFASVAICVLSVAAGLYIGKCVES